MELNHFDHQGNAVMVDVSEKENTSREAVAEGFIHVNSEVYRAIANGAVKKGDVLTVAQVAGIMGTKKTAELIPMCHLLNLTNAKVTFEMLEESQEIRAVCQVKTEGKTGVEMEALTGVSVALLTIYDMCKALDKTMEIRDIHVCTKSGGKSGDFVNPQLNIQAGGQVDIQPDLKLDLPLADKRQKKAAVSPSPREEEPGLQIWADEGTPRW
ncbi:cyclic pyranopterin phosphate synthase [Hespellia stercorisuis DSM 15480]|uniref:Cyclic pyranopterin monophosphate synthase n=1 Tax=Hespellia stercorisuis DSM 15480 TaxID=1121950 RepID=A0A1M6UE02_9FIRM|nr:cyclic pyranopterin monophosphate synthase MoaC [Hespellia stercorisuis]SHK67400.1 cyclic pyranopterin phosphate synthase [Hespellia stercorisuis DSM 15480]